MGGEGLSSRHRSRAEKMQILGAILFVGLLCISTVKTLLPVQVLIFYVVASLVTFIAYALDKTAAVEGRSRIPESTLHFLSLAGGWPGAIVAQQRFRHKTQKQPFRSIFWITISLNLFALSVLLWALTPEGAAFLQTLINELS